AAQGGEGLRGIGACSGQVEGVAAVLADAAEGAALDGPRVVVTRQTDPGWASVFFLASGLVVERGGMLSHGAIIAREFGIPAVVGVTDATRRLASGQRLFVDGDRGEVRILG
ncbi:MAG: phosphoenolpyruvate synthase, partial [Rhodocyclaceae bacterium]|nr:phosphoenolpyruvate synthase [Rhodocyclaceae bacterium]